MERVTKLSTTPKPPTACSQLLAYFIVFTILDSSISLATYAGLKELSVRTEEEELVKIKNSTVKLTPVYRGGVYMTIKGKEKNEQLVKLQRENCEQSMQEYYCLKMYGDGLSSSTTKTPNSLLQLNIDPLYVVLTYRTIVSDINDKKRLEKETLVVCLNPKVPLGYWNIIDKYIPVLKSSPKTDDPKNSGELLKLRACMAFVTF